MGVNGILSPDHSTTEDSAGSDCSSYSSHNYYTGKKHTFRTYGSNRLERSDIADSADSDDSLDGTRPTLSAWERECLLMDSHSFRRLYENYQPELQQIITQLFNCTEDFLDEYSEAARRKRRGDIAAVTGAAAVGLGLILAPFTAGLSLAVFGAGGIIAAAGGGVASLRGDRKKLEEEKKVLDEVEKNLERFSTATGRLLRPLENICERVEKILQHHCDEDLRQRAGGSSQSAELFNPEDLQSLLEQGQKTLRRAEDINPDDYLQVPSFDCPSLTEDIRTPRDAEKLKKLFSVQEKDLESKAGQFVCKMREVISHLQDILDEITCSRSEVERVIIPRLSQCFNP